MRYATDQALAAIPELAEVPPEDLQAVVDDANRVYNYIRQNEWITDRSLRSYGERNGIDPDRMNLALALLRSQGRVYALDAPIPGTEEDPSA